MTIYSSNVKTIAFLLISTLGLVGCSGSSNNNDVAPTSVVQVITFELSGNQEIPAVETDATGIGTMNLEAGGQITGGFSVSGMQATAAHIHRGFAGQNGEVLVALVPGSPGVFVVPPGTTLSAADQASFANGGLYINVHSAAFPAGELRAQLLTPELTILYAELSGRNEVPAVVTSATGRAGITINTSTRDLVLHVTTSGLDDASAAHIHRGFAGTTGGVEVGLTQDPDDANHWSATGTFTDEQYAALWTGELYVNVHSPANPPGEIRGQLTPDNITVLVSSLSGD